MSEELRDEVEAINSIYGEGCLAPADDDPEHESYILKLPGDASSLRLRFPEAYPAGPPTVLGTHHSSGGRRGAGARDLGLFRDAVGSVFREGAVCLFDAVEEFTRRHEEEVAQRRSSKASRGDEAEGESGGAAGRERAVLREPAASAVDDVSLPRPSWTVSSAVTESKSTFVAHVARVSSAAQAARYVQQLVQSERRVRDATHNITAWRVRGPGPGPGAQEDCDDDGEAAAGGRLLRLLRVMEVWDAVVVVTRWYGGVRLGPRRFALINAAARDGLVRAGLVVANERENRERNKAK